MLHSARGSRGRRRFFRRHPMGLPTVLLVALLAAGGFYWTVHAPNRTGNLAAADELTIERGCLMEASELCASDGQPLATMGQPTAALRPVCQTAPAQGLLEVWEDESGGRGLHWSIPAVASALYPFESPWVALWSKSNPVLVRTAEVPEGWAPLPPAMEHEELVVWAGSTAMGGSLVGGIALLRVHPLGVQGDAGLKLAAHVNGDNIVLEVPPDAPMQIMRAKESLSFSSWTTGALECPAA